ncbi:hypothetical protein A3C26_04325 [Candidatus Daviesbacteria bacterium RIFCSPHIGHO2_02_FULL_39_12]|uniref:Uncharacterized protein n=2 Tax=Candidatus Daviesiibacteriota TaxID=1752718 RepID=A0A1F5JDD0_9BACT|nr:MAG: hypothetical protein A3C26_04325 [Candidatus Daviesbacteria bacterium RIFCSPHIGHO2_02_FULL_39_12]OGE71592.1 MAG: hypothetical protein A3H40_03945 [Candidatus Daviesbacteria bacterium RIFCSPLOWO2_02_FULL_38_15]
MVKLIVLDVDGVIVGNKKGINFPYPNKSVISTLQKVHLAGIPIVLCSGKYHSAIDPIISKAQLQNPHITDSGSLILNPITSKIIREFNINKKSVAAILKTCLQNNIYLEVYTADNYFIQKDQMSEITPRRTLVLQNDPEVVNSLAEEIKHHRVIKMLPVAVDEQDRQRIESVLLQHSNKVKFLWSQHPFTMPFQYCLITAKNVSKANSLKVVADTLGITLENTLGVGDTMGDWEFMDLCEYVATMLNAPDELKEKVKSKGKGKYLIAPSVDDNGILKILDYFLKPLRGRLMRLSS